MAKKFVRGITDIRKINEQDFDTNNVNDLLSDGEHNYIHRKKKDKTEEYHNLTNNIKTISSDNGDLLTVTNYNNSTNSATLHPHHDAQKEQVIESTRNTIDIDYGENGTTETTKVDTNPQVVLEHNNLKGSASITIQHREGEETTVISVHRNLEQQVIDNSRNIHSIQQDLTEAKKDIINVQTDVSNLNVQVSDINDYLGTLTTPAVDDYDTYINKEQTVVANIQILNNVKRLKSLTITHDAYNNDNYMRLSGIPLDNTATYFNIKKYGSTFNDSGVAMVKCYDGEYGGSVVVDKVVPILYFIDDNNGTDTIKLLNPLSSGVTEQSNIASIVFI